VVHWFSSTNKTCRNICFHYCFILPLLSKEYIEKKNNCKHDIINLNAKVKSDHSTFKSFVIVQISHVTRKESAIIPKHDSHLIYISPITVPQLQWSAVTYVVHVSTSNSCCSICVVYCISLFLLFLLAIVLSVLRFTDSDYRYLFGIFKLFLKLLY
jgi:hypothetical protein